LIVGKQSHGAWDTREVLEMVRSMRHYNDDPKHPRKVKFYGFDMQEDLTALDSALRYLDGVDREAASAIAGQVRPLIGRSLFIRYRELSPDQRGELTDAVATMLAQFDARKPDDSNRSRADAWAVARRDAVVLQQCIELVAANLEGETPKEFGSFVDAYYTSAGRAKALQEYLDASRPEVGVKVRPLLDSLQRPYEVISRDYRKLGADRRDALDAQAAEIAKALSGVKIEPADAVAEEAIVRMKSHSEVVTNLLKMLRLRSGRPEQAKVVRDRCMAENVSWILEHEGPDSKIVLWSHNFHAYKEPAPPGCGYMGAELDRRFGRAQVIIGFAFGRGSFRASSKSLSIYEKGKPKYTVAADCQVPPPIAGSIDGTLGSVGIPIFAVDLRNGPMDGPVAEWLRTDHPLRDAGALYVPESDANHYYPVTPARDFDVMIFTDRTTATLPNLQYRERCKMPMVLPPEVGLLPGSWRVAKIEISSAKADLDDNSRRRFEETRAKIDGTLRRIKSGELTITTSYRADGHYTHELRFKDRPQPTYTEDGTWSLDATSGLIVGKATREPESTIDGFRVRRLTRDELVLRKDFHGEREGTIEELHMERVR
jgi:erythromycin esterase-like protein